MKASRIHAIRAWAALVSLAFAGGCFQSDLEEIKNNQKDISKKLAALEKKVGASPSRQRPKRPPVDYNKVHKISESGLAFKGAKNAKVTIVEFTDYQ